MAKEKKKATKKGVDENLIKKISLTLLITLILISAINVVQIFSLDSDFSEAIERKIEEQKSAQVSLTIIDPKCEECFDIGEYVNSVSGAKKTNVTSTIALDLDSSKARELIEKYGIDKFPALVVEGDIDQSGSLVSTLTQIGNRYDDETYYLTPSKPLYTDKSGEVIGKVEAFAIDNPDCKSCDRSEDYIDEFKKIGVEFSSIDIYDINLKEAEKLIVDYGLDKAPNIVFSNELGLYPEFKSGWEEAGTIEDDGSYVLRYLRLPYYSLEESRLVGALDFTYVYDSSCENCFNAKEVFDAIFAQFGISASNKRVVNIEENSSLVDKYGIEKVPALIVNGDVNYYDIFKSWDEVGTIEDDGSYIFRNVDLLDLEYKDLD